MSIASPAGFKLINTARTWNRRPGPPTRATHVKQALGREPAPGSPDINDLKHRSPSPQSRSPTPIGEAAHQPPTEIMEISPSTHGAADVSADHDPSFSPSGGAVRPPSKTSPAARFHDSGALSSKLRVSAQPPSHTAPKHPNQPCPHPHAETANHRVLTRPTKNC